MSQLMCFFMLSMVYSTTLSAESATAKGLRIAKLVDKANKGFKGDSAVITMTLYTAAGEKTLRKMSSKTKEVRSQGNKSLVTLIAPADVRGTKMLTWAYKKKDDLRWLYMPALKRTKRIAGRAVTGSFMGSEFSYEDMSTTEIEKYSYKFIKEEKCGKHKCWVIDSFPKNRNSGYKRTRNWIDKSYKQGIKSVFYDRHNRKLKTMVGSSFKSFKIGKKTVWRPLKSSVVNHQTRKRTTVVTKKLRLGINHSSDTFAQENLEE